MKIYLVTWLGEKSQGESLTNVGYKHRLLSYYHFVKQRMTVKHLKEYVKTGKVDPKKYPLEPRKIDMMQLLEKPKKSEL